MSIPLDKMIDKEANVYEMTCVAIKEAVHLAKMDNEGKLKKEVDPRDPEKQLDVKVVSAALEKVLDGEVEYSIEGDK